MAEVANKTSASPEIRKTFELLEEGAKHIKLSDKYKNVTLVLGNTGAGKSTLIQFLAGDNDKLNSIAKGIGEFIIEDAENRIGSGIYSKTIFPELVVDVKTNEAFYDCPGFGDTRDTSHDIAATYFIKQLTDYVENLKIVLVVSYPAVGAGVDRQDLRDLLRHTIDLVKNIEKYNQSIALIVTKVENRYEKKQKNLILVSDEAVISDIARFLHDVIKQILDSQSKVGDLSSKQKNLNHNTIKILDILSKKKNENFPRIGIFRRPDEPGPLSNITLLKEGKEHIEKILHEELKFTQKSQDDFGYTISEKSKNDITILVESINGKVLEEVSKIARKIEKYYEDLIKEMNIKIGSFLHSVEVVEASKVDAENFSLKLNCGIRNLSLLSEEIKNNTIKDLGTKVSKTVTLLKIDTCRENLEIILTQGNYFEFLQSFSVTNLNTMQWSENFREVEIYLQGNKTSFADHIFQSADSINGKVWGQASEIATKINNYYGDLIKGMKSKIHSFLHSVEAVEASKVEAENFLLKLNSGIRNLSLLSEETKIGTYPKDLGIKLNETVSLLRIDTCRENLDIILTQRNYFDFLQSLSDRNLNTRPWSELFQKVEIYLSNAKVTLQEHVFQLAQKIVETIRGNNSIIAIEIKNYFVKIMDSREIEALPVDLKRGLTILMNFTTETDNFINAQELSKKTSECLKNLNIPIDFNLQNN